GSLLYEESWELSPAPLPVRLTGPWVLAVPAGAPAALADQAERALTGAGATVHRLGAGSDRASLAASLAALEDHPEGVLSLGSLDTAPAGGGATRGLLATLALVQAAADAGLDAPVWALTSGAADTTGDGPVPHPEGALVAGLGRALALEDPVRFGGVVDLPAGPHAGLPDDLAGHLVAALAAGDGEDQVAVRADGRYVRRLRRTAPLGASKEWTTGGTAVVTGGQGALGRHLAGFLADRGAAHIVLASRRGELTEETGELRARLAARGVALTVAACDVTDRAQVDALLAGADSPGHPLRFVAHLAGVTGMAPYTALSAEEAVHVTAAKVLGATHLHEALGARPLDGFVLYGSVAGLWGGAGQAVYSAANAALDALARH
ncbi:beta-ketoacyl reductase, partial [Streptomyces diastaticus]